jgi:hypothetical protein
MDENDLRRLADEPTITAERPRPLDAVLGRSRQLHRRRRALRALGATVLVAVLVGAGTLTTRDHSEVATAPPPPPPVCPVTAGEEVPEAELGEPSASVPPQAAESLLYLPTDLPEGLEITEVAAWSDQQGWCPEGPLLALQADGGDATVDATIRVLGPFDDQYVRSYSRPEGTEQIETPTRVRDVDATRITVPQGGGSTLTAFTWTDPAGVGWIVEGREVDEAILRDVVEGLVLDFSGTPPADLPAEAVPSGWELTWRSPTPLTADEAAWDPHTWWYVNLGQTSEGCTFRFRTATADEPPVTAVVGVGEELTSVRGHEARRGDGYLEWSESDGVRVELYCGAETADLVRIAESLEKVTPDDPRIAPVLLEGVPEASYGPDGSYWPQED